ncbi:sensor histidine kinase [Gracilibacillus phocaeensis]|uniref:sensor histidine kinase n=1 Tax=Gracilibacillus phocaeensis TaxID=2042304 RepID=UPI0010315073|nr:sensor histidine kinase [Gracilibacillus phocaeensis]
MRVLFRGVTSPSFRSKVFIASFLCIGIPVILSLSIYSYLTRDAVEEQAKQNAIKELNLTEEGVGKLLDDMLNVSNYVQMDSALNTTLKNKSNLPLSTFEHQGYKAFLEDRNIQKTVDDITLLGEKSFVTILLKNGKYYTNYSTSQFDPNSFHREQWFDQLQQLNGFETLWIGLAPTMLSYEKVHNPYQLSIARTLRSSSKEIYGYVIVTLLETRVRDLLISQESTEELYLIDGKDMILSHQDESKINEKANFVEKLDPYKDAQMMTLEDQQYVVTQKQLTFNDWKLISKVPYQVATSNITSIFTKVFIMLAISFIIFFIILAYLINRITRPIKHLDKVVQKVQTGNLSVRSSVTSADEIGQFSDSFNQMLDRINSMIDEVSVTHQRKRKAELAMLQAQINPHFLFNVLNSIRMKVFRFGDKDSAAMIQSLSKLLRWTIENQADKITFADELELLQDYVRLMNMRQKNKVTLVLQCSDKAKQQFVPRFLLQPIIENAIIHGFNKGEGTISIKAETTQTHFNILITDNGTGMEQNQVDYLNNAFESPDTMKKLGPHTGFSNIGMANVHERLRLSFPDKPKMVVTSKKWEGTSIEIVIPLGGEKDVQGNVS